MKEKIMKERSRLNEFRLPAGQKTQDTTVDLGPQEIEKTVWNLEKKGTLTYTATRKTVLATFWARTSGVTAR